MSLLFTVVYTLSSERGVVVVGWASSPETPLPKKGEPAEVRNPDGSTFRVEVSDVDVTFSTRSCFTSKTANRAILIARGEGVSVLAGAEISSSAETNP